MFAALLRRPDRLGATDSEVDVWPLDDEVAARIRAIGVHPILMVRVGNDPRKSEPRYVICKTQNELPEFVEQLNRLPRLADLKLLHGLERALQAET